MYSVSILKKTTKADDICAFTYKTADPKRLNLSRYVFFFFFLLFVLAVARGVNRLRGGYKNVQTSKRIAG